MAAHEPIKWVPIYTITDNWIDDKGNGGSDAKLNVCSLCGAAVMVDALGIHAAFHERIDNLEADSHVE